MTSPPHPKLTDDTLQLLAERRRRQVLRHLAEGDTPTTVDRLVDAILDASDAETDATRERLRIQLHHAHLPKLQAAGVIEYDPRRKTIRRGSAFRDVIELYRAIRAYNDEFV